MPAVDVTFARQVAESSILQNSREMLTNMFAEIETGGRTPFVVRQRAGLKLQFAATGVKRAIEQYQNLTYAVIDNQLRVFDGVVETVLGTLSTISGRCSIIFDDNGKVAVSDQKNLYHYDGSTFSLVTTPTTPGTLAFMSGFGVYGSVGAGQFYVSKLNDLSTWDALDFATAESVPDNLVRVFSDHNELWLFGERSVEIWQLSGAVDFPFARYTNLQMNRGLAAAFSVCSDDNTIFWLGDDLIVYRAEGYRPIAISNSSVARLIASVPVTAISKADAFVYTIEGEKFYTIRFPDYLTVQINIKTGAWNVAKTYQKNDWRVLGSAGHYQNYLLTDEGYSTLDYSSNQDNGLIMEREGVSSPISVGGARFAISEFFLDAEVGRAASGVTPRVMLRVSRDGETFGNERWRNMGVTGSYKKRPVWRNLGLTRDATLMFSVTDDFAFKVIGAKANING